MYAIEQREGITYAEVGIEVGHCPPSGNCLTKCPECIDKRKAEHRNDRDLSVDVEKGQGKCHHCGWTFGLGKLKKERDGTEPLPPGTLRDRYAARDTVNVNTSAAEPVVTKPEPLKLPTVLHEWAKAYLKERGIGPITAGSMGIVSTEKFARLGGKDTIHFPYFLAGALVNVKHRAVAEKDFGQHPGAPRTLYNLDACEGAEVIVIVEGEIDALSCIEAGWSHVVSAPDGAPGSRIIDGVKVVGEAGRKLDAFKEPTAARVLNAAKRIVIATDADEEGQALAEALIKLLGPVKCWRVMWPHGVKDANEVLMQGGPEVLDHYLGKATPVDLPGIVPMTHYLDDLLHIYDQGFDKGVSTGWESFDRLFTVRKGTVNLITGVPGNGKTSWELHLFANLAHLHGWRIALFTPEAGSGGTLLAKLVQVAMDAPLTPGVDERMTKEQLRAGAKWVAEHFWRIDAHTRMDDGSTYNTIEDVVARTEALILRHGIDVLSIDPWNRIETKRQQGLSDTDHIGACVNELGRLATRHNVAVFVVIHPHKPPTRWGSDEEEMPGMYNLSGSAHWANMGDVIMGVRRNKKTEPLNQTTVEVLKQREEGIAGALGEMPFFYDARSRRYHTSAVFAERVGANPYPVLPRSLV